MSMRAPDVGQVASTAADVYMLGSLLFELLTGCACTPFFWLPMEDVLVFRRHESTRRLNTMQAAAAVGRDIPWAVTGPHRDQLVALVHACLHVEPASRPSLQQVGVCSAVGRVVCFLNQQRRRPDSPSAAHRQPS